MNQTKIFDSETVLPEDRLSARQNTILGFEERYCRIHARLRLMFNIGALKTWNQKHYSGKLLLCDLVAEQYPFVIFHGDVGTGKSVTAECIANRLVAEARAEDSVLFKLSNRVRGTGKVGEMGTLLSEAFAKVTQSAGRGRRAILVIDEGDSLAASRAQEHSHHEDKVAVMTLIQAIDDLRRFEGRVLIFLCTNRRSVLDAALQRRAAIIEEFTRPSDEERRSLFLMDLAALSLSDSQLSSLVRATGAQNGYPVWTYSDIRTRLYPAALALAFPERPLSFDDLCKAAASLQSSPVMED